MYVKREHMPEHFAFCAFQGSGASEDVAYVESVKAVGGEPVGAEGRGGGLLGRAAP